MELLYKPDFEDAKLAWRHYWAKEAWRRPLVVCSVPRPGRTPSLRALGDGRYAAAASGRWRSVSRKSRSSSRRENIRRVDSLLRPRLRP
jgi:hypothetical protein